MNILELGWNEFHETHYNKVKTADTFPARVAKAQREKYSLFSAFGEMNAEINGKIRFAAVGRSDLPAVGDWVVAQKRSEGDVAVIEAILPRRNKLSRKVAGTTADEQVLSANLNRLSGPKLARVRLCRVKRLER